MSKQDAQIGLWFAIAIAIGVGGIVGGGIFVHRRRARVEGPGRGYAYRVAWGG